MSSKNHFNRQRKEIAVSYYIILSELLLLKTIQNATSQGLTKEEIIQQLREKIKLIKKHNPFFRIQWPTGQDLSGELFKFKELKFIDNDLVDDKIIWKAKENEKGEYYLNVWLQESEKMDIPDFKLLFES